MIKEAIIKISQRQDLREEEMKLAMKEILVGQATPAQIGAFITALKMKGESAEEVTAAVSTLRNMALRVDARSSVVVDTAGTGGDGLNTFNISTTAAFVVAASGITVAKHGNRSVSSRSGSADVLEALGVNILADPEVMEECLQEIGIGFLFAPTYHQAMKHVQSARREIGVRTIFNMLGPLINPSGANAQLIGVYEPRLTEMFALVLKNLGTRRAFVVHGHDGLDEASIFGPSRVTELCDGIISTYDLHPEEYFSGSDQVDAISGGDPATNARITRGILSGDQGAPRNIVLLNAALGIVAGGKARDVKEGISLAARAIDSGEAMRKLDELIAHSRS
ncbi:MAG: anthranilate phosphoribosyltransferase [Smithellaceae bacterium]|nr:anthranilate phosphoribosyltransferase [Smithellaceae bacterium]